MSFAGDYSLDIFDTYSFLIISPCAFLTSCILIFAQLTNRQLLKQPGDLIFMVSISELFLSVHYFMTALRTSYITVSYRESSPFCTWNAYFDNVFGTLEYLYNVCIMCHIFFTLKSAIQKSFVPKFLYHFANIAITVLFNVFYVYSNRLGKSPYGICSLRAGEKTGTQTVGVYKDLWMSLAMLVCGVTLGIFILFYTSRTLPNFGREYNDLKRDFLNYYKNYIQACILIWIIIFGSQVAQVIGQDQHMLLSENQNWFGALFAIGRLGNTAKAVMPLLLFFIRIQDPLIRKKIWSPFSRIKTRISKIDLNLIQSINSNRESTNSLNDPLSGGAGEDSSANNMANQVEAESNDLMWMNLLPSKIKESYTRTFLACIQRYYVERLEQKKLLSDSTNKLDFQDATCYSIQGQGLMKELKTSKSLINCKFTIYSPGLFKSVLDSSYKKVDIGASLDIVKNEDNIRKAGESGGGASGELFMFSHDGQLILKTATHDEIEVFKDILLDYKEHFRVYRKTQISKIFGLFDFNFEGSDKSIKLILMENLFTVNKEAVLRKYDMKGSKHSRKVLKNYTGVSKDTKIDKIMKDIDFLEIDKLLAAGSERREEITKYVDMDVYFFRTHNIIDFSLILAVCDARLLTDPSYLDRERNNNPHFIQSADDPNIFYLFGIIDYFQLYTFSKAAERFFKRLSKCNPSLDTSSQPPRIYSNRFNKFLERILK